MSLVVESEAVRVGAGDYTYETVEDWAKLPDGWSFNDVSGVAIDGKDNVYVFNRGEHPVIVFDRHGNFLKSWGEGLFRRPHGACIGPDDTIWLTDDLDHCVRKCTLDGKVLLTLGTPGRGEPFMSGRPFSRPTHTALSPSGDVYVSDGYWNSRVHKYSPDGKLLKSWGGPGTDPGEFHIVHNLTCDDEGWLYVADRENFRIQIFNPDGRFETQWHNLYRPQGLFTTRGSSPVTFVGEAGPPTPVAKSVPNLGARVTILDHNGNRIGRLGGWQPGIGPSEYLGPHGIALDSHGDLYVGEVSWNTWSKKFPGEERPHDLRSLRKLRKVQG